jgi:hypothetical protein
MAQKRQDNPDEYFKLLPVNQMAGRSFWILKLKGMFNDIGNPLLEKNGNPQAVLSRLHFFG